MSTKKAIPRKEAKKRKKEEDITQEIVKQDPEELKIKEFRWTENQARAIETILDKNTKILFLSGPAGSAKTLVSVYCALQLMKEKKAVDMTYIRSIVESASNKIGFLPGGIEDKTGPYFAPLEEKLEELLPRNQISDLVAKESVKSIPVSYLRGAGLGGVLLVDEAQCFDFKELTTIITRIKEGAKMIFTGDFGQVDSKSSGFKDFFKLFDTEQARANGIFCQSFDKTDIKRSRILKFICDEIENRK